MQDDGSLFAINMTDLSAYLTANFGPFVTADQVRSLYPPGLSDNAVIAESYKDVLFLWSDISLFPSAHLTTSCQPCRALERCGRGCGGDRCIPIYIRYGHVHLDLLLD
jgi:hypothetical protein